MNFKISHKSRQIVNLKKWASNADNRLARYKATDTIDTDIQAISQIFKETKEESTFTIKSFRRR